MITREKIIRVRIDKSKNWSKNKNGNLDKKFKIKTAAYFNK